MKYYYIIFNPNLSIIIIIIFKILTADDRQLNAWVSLKKATQYRSDREEQYDIQAYEKKARDAARKKRIFSKDFGEKTTKYCKF